MKTLLILSVCLLSFSGTKSQIVFGDYIELDNIYGNIGSMHNRVLENCYLNLPIQEGYTYDQAVTYIANYNKKFLSSIAKSSNYFDTKQINSEFAERKSYVNKKTFTEQLLDGNKSNSIDGINRELAKYPILSSQNQLILSQISEKMKENLSGVLSNEDFEKDLVSIYNDFETKNDEQGKEIIGQVITISLLSCEWWRKNPTVSDEPKSLGGKGGPSLDGFENNAPYAVPVVALDAAGALISAGSVALNNYINNGSVSWAAVGTGAVVGAVTGSTGLVGKVGKWISSLF